MKLTRLNGRTRFTNTRIRRFVLLNLLDFELTASMILLGMGVEGNPLLGSSLWGIGAVKLVGTVGVVKFLGSSGRVMGMLNIGLGMVVAWNLALFVILQS